MSGVKVGLLKSFPRADQKCCGTLISGGYAGPAVADGRVFITDYVTIDDVKVDNFDRKEFTGQTHPVSG